MDDQVVRYADSENRLHKLKLQSTTFCVTLGPRFCLSGGEKDTLMGEH